MAEPQVMVLQHVDKLPDGRVRAVIYASVNNLPLGHLEINAASLEGLKALMNGMTDWIVKNDSAIIRPDGRRMPG